MNTIKKHWLLLTVSILAVLFIWVYFFAANLSFYGYAQVTHKEKIDSVYHIYFDGVEESEIRIRENQTVEYETEAGQVKEVRIDEVWGTIEPGNNYFLNMSRSRIPDYWRLHKLYEY
ncbi:hypothetical protein ADIAL_1157 [Alkalibacterium sp. AK22]|uniref:hypothetical protein n=1 Tax=Alkalibacterium sp. AK22 TaxID=1229520 RepID=UPI00044C4A91|nr:hypothetical protein [Alkalibacterium sp. AK22]EXJ23399.1 hypothetical protein ADIAL_1157 [Alkalibacterium sp. AK22]